MTSTHIKTTISIFSTYEYYNTSLHKVGLFTNDLFFFLFETYFLLAMIILLLFFVFLSNTKRCNGNYFIVINSLINLTFFIVILLFIILLFNPALQFGFFLFNGLYHEDYFSISFKILLLLYFFIFLFFIKFYLSPTKNYDFEFIIIFLISLFSSTLLLNSNDLISLFFIIELQSLSFYVLVASKQTSSFSTEGGLKYFILGSFSSGIILFGVSLIYGFTGLLSYSDLALFFPSALSTDTFSLPIYGCIIGIIFLSIGLLFKLGAAPFHMWIPDVYEGAPFIVLVYLSTIPKISLIFIYFKLYFWVFSSIFLYYQFLFSSTALLSIIIGSIAAIYQTKLKRLLTYSMITNSGYLLLGLSIGGVSGLWVTLFYLLSYIFIMIGLFACFILLRDFSNGFLIKKLSMLANLFEVNSVLAFSIFVFLFSIAGIPPLLGFYGKLFLFLFALKAKLYWLIVLFIVFSTISVFYYIRVVKMMYFNRASGWFFIQEIPFNIAVIIAFIVLINCIFFVCPNIILTYVHNIAFYFFI